MTPTKAVLAAVLAACASLVATLQGRQNLDGMHVSDWVIVVGSAIVAGLTVWVIPNSPKR